MPWYGLSSKRPDPKVCRLHATVTHGCVKSHRFHFAVIILTYITLCEIRKTDCDILLHCQSAGNLAILSAVSVHSSEEKKPNPKNPNTKQKATQFLKVFIIKCIELVDTFK